MCTRPAMSWVLRCTTHGHAGASYEYVRKGHCSAGRITGTPGLALEECLARCSREARCQFVAVIAGDYAARVRVPRDPRAMAAPILQWGTVTVVRA